MKTDTDGKPGLRIETAASITLRDTIQQHMGNFAYVIRTDRAANTCGTEVIDMTIKVLRDAIDRDLRHLARV